VAAGRACLLSPLCNPSGFAPAPLPHIQQQIFSNRQVVLPTLNQNINHQLSTSRYYSQPQTSASTAGQPWACGSTP
jgi:hypothetical protein